MIETISGPDDLKCLSVDELDFLSKEIRQRIIDVLAQKGGHLASNLGSVELLTALHYVFNSPKDKFVFDVGHQAYTHKILTGRNQDFPSLRQYKGVCGFPHPEESPHDHFHAGHAGTALSLSLGLAKNRDLSERDEHVLPIIGDASLTCGLTLEALNHISKDLSKFLVILNDNAMSISKNVGTISNILSRFFNQPAANRFYDEIQGLLSKIPSYGNSLAKQGRRLKESFKHLVSSQASFFEQYNLSYVGPIDGHDIKALVETFEALKNSSAAVVVHVITQKGKGMNAAIENPVSFHGVKPFNPDTGKILGTSKKSEKTFPQVFGQELLKMAENDPSLLAVTPAMSKGSCLDAMMEKFPSRCLDVGIAEGHALTFCGGMAYGKKIKVVASVYSTFVQRALDNVFLDVCLQELPVMIALDRSGLSPADGATHHGIYDLGFLKQMPNLAICCPRNAQVLRELMNSAFSWERPVAIRYPNLKTLASDEPLKKRELGKAELLRAGKDLLIIAMGHMVNKALDLADLLGKIEVDAAVLDPVFVKPLDHDTLHKLFMLHKRVVCIEEHSIQGGLCNSIKDFIVTAAYKQTDLLCFAIPDQFVGHGDYASLMKEIGLDTGQIYQKIVEEFSLQKVLLG